MEPLACRHATTLTPTVLKCELLRKHGIAATAGYSKHSYPCHKCRKHWNGSEAPEELPEAIRKMFPSVTGTHPRGAGLGDMVHAVTSALGIPECGGCAKRREWLNKIGLGWRG